MLSIQTLKRVDEMVLRRPELSLRSLNVNSKSPTPLSLVLCTVNAAVKPSDDLSLLELLFQWERRAGHGWTGGSRASAGNPCDEETTRNAGEGWRGKEGNCCMGHYS